MAHASELTIQYTLQARLVCTCTKLAGYMHSCALCFVARRVCGRRLHASLRAGLQHSADGISWHSYTNGEGITYRAADSYNTVRSIAVPCGCAFRTAFRFCRWALRPQLSWLPASRQYLMTTRTDFGTPHGPSLHATACLACQSACACCRSGQLARVRSHFRSRVVHPLALAGWREIRGVRTMVNPDVKAAPHNWTLLREWSKPEPCRVDPPPHRQTLIFMHFLSAGRCVIWIGTLIGLGSLSAVVGICMVSP